MQTIYCVISLATVTTGLFLHCFPQGAPHALLRAMKIQTAGFKKPTLVNSKRLWHIACVLLLFCLHVYMLPWTHVVHTDDYIESLGCLESTKKASHTLVWTGIIFSFLSDVTRRQANSNRTRTNLPNHHHWVGYSWRGRGRRRFNRMTIMRSRSWTWYACVWVNTERLMSWLWSVTRCLLACLWWLISCCLLWNHVQSLFTCNSLLFQGLRAA